jgi:hypothetical protein
LTCNDGGLRDAGCPDKNLKSKQHIIFLGDTMGEELFNLGDEEEKEEEVEEERYDRIVETFSKALINIIVSKMKKLIEQKKISKEDVYDLWEAISEEIDIKIYDYLEKLAEE